MRNEQDILQEAIPLIKQDEKNLLYFFSKAKDPKWFEHLRTNDLFNPNTIPHPIKTEMGFILSVWPQQSYLEHLSNLIHDKEITNNQFINNFLDVFRKITSTNGNFLLARALFLSMMRVPTTFLAPSDVDLVFKWLRESRSKDTLAERTVHEGLSFLLKSLSDNANDRVLFKTYFNNLLILSESKKDISNNSSLLFFSEYGHNEFRHKFFNVNKIVSEKPYVLFDALEIAESKLIDLLTNSDIDKSTQYWRPAVEEHPQNNYHDSAQAIIVGIISSTTFALNSVGNAIPNLEMWKNSPYKTFNRIYFSIASVLSDTSNVEDVATKIIELGFISECRHEIYQFLNRQFDRLSPTSQDKLLDIIEGIVSDYADSDSLNLRHSAWEKLRWIEAVVASKNSRVSQIRKQLMVITDGKVPDHPDFSTYMSVGWVGPTSPNTVENLSKQSADEVLELLLNFKNSSEFGSPSIEGLSRVLEEWITVDPMKGTVLVSSFSKLDAQYISAILDGYSKAWGAKKYVPLQDIIEHIQNLVSTEYFENEVIKPESKFQWVVASICRFVETGTRDDENSFPTDVDLILYSILKRSLTVCPADNRYGSSSDFYSRAINEPRGRIFGALIVLTLRRARISKNNPVNFQRAWDDLRLLIEPIIKRQNDNEVSLHSLIGAYYRQFQFLSKDWVFQNMNFIAPSKEVSPILWQSFMDGFSYVTEYSKEMYQLLKDKGYILNYLRLESEAGMKNSRSNRLQTRMIELSLVAYILGHDNIDTGIVGDIIEKKLTEEWHQMIWSIKSIIGQDPKPEHLIKAKDLITKLLDIRDSASPNLDLKDHFRGLGGFLDILKEPTDPMVSRIIKVVSGDKESPWELGDLVQYLHKFKDSHNKTVGELFNLILSISETIPSWPPEIIREVCLSLVEHGETNSMIDICRYYSERSISCEPIRDICNSLGR